MTAAPLFPGFDGLMTLHPRGVDIRPTLLRVLTDLYVQASAHSADERQFVELTSRLIDQVDDATRRGAGAARDLSGNAGRDHEQAWLAALPFRPGRARGQRPPTPSVRT